MKPVTEITYQEYEAIKEEMRQKAKEFADAALKAGWTFPASHNQTLYFCNSSSKTPCLYRKRGVQIDEKGHNPATGKNCLLKPVPKGYRVNRKPHCYIHHLAKDGCPLLKPFESVVQCTWADYSGPNPRYFTCEHLVGDCPGKE